VAALVADSGAGGTHAAPVHGGDVLAAARRWGLNPAEILDFSANINPAGPPPGVLARVQEALAGIRHYPEPYARTLREVIAKRHGVAPENVLVANGASEAIYLLARLSAGRRVAVPAPGFAEYARAAAAVGAKVVAYPAEPRLPAAPVSSAPSQPSAALRAPAGPEPAAAVVSQLVDLPGLPLASAQRLQAGDLLILCNPHNPTGRLLSPAEVLHLADLTEATVVVDEAFIDLTDPGEAASVLPWVEQRPNLVVLRSLTKFYAMPGLRVGYAVAAAELVAQLDRARDPWSVGSLAQVAALAALEDVEYAARTRKWIGQERPFLAEALSRLPGYEVAPPSANFILVRGPVPIWTLQERLGPKGILVRDCRSFAGLTDRHMRLAVRSRAENLRLLEALAE